MAFKENDLVYWNDPNGGRDSQSGIVRAVKGDHYVLDGGNGGTIKAKPSELERM